MGSTLVLMLTGHRPVHFLILIFDKALSLVLHHAMQGLLTYLEECHDEVRAAMLWGGA